MSSKGTNSDKEKGKDKERYCVTFVPQAWRKHVCKNCFRTRPQHEAEETIEPAENKPKDGDSGVSNIAAKFGKNVKGEKPSNKQSGAKGAAAAAAASSEKSPTEVVAGSPAESTVGKSGPAAKPDSLVAQRKAGLFKKETGPGQSGSTGPGLKGKGQKSWGLGAGAGNNGKKKGGTGSATGTGNGATESGEAGIDRNGKKSGGSSPLSPKSQKKSPLSPVSTKKSPLSPTSTKKSPLSPVSTKKSPLSPPTKKKSPLSPPTTKKSPLSPPMGKKVGRGWKQDTWKDKGPVGKSWGKKNGKWSDIKAKEEDKKQNIEGKSEQKSDSRTAETDSKLKTSVTVQEEKPSGGDEVVAAKDSVASAGDGADVKITTQVTGVGEVSAGEEVKVQSADDIIVAGEEGVGIAVENKDAGVDVEDGSDICVSASFSLSYSSEVLSADSDLSADIADNRQQQPVVVQEPPPEGATVPEVPVTAARGLEAPTSPLSPTAALPSGGQEGQLQLAPSAGADVKQTSEPLLEEQQKLPPTHPQEEVVEGQGQEEKGGSLANQQGVVLVEGGTQEDPNALTSSITSQPPGEAKEDEQGAAEGAEQGQGAEGQRDPGGAVGATGGDQEDFTQGGTWSGTTERLPQPQEQETVTLTQGEVGSDPLSTDTATQALSLAVLPQEASPDFTPSQEEVSIPPGGGITDKPTSDIIQAPVAPTADATPIDDQAVTVDAPTETPPHPEQKEGEICEAEEEARRQAQVERAPEDPIVSTCEEAKSEIQPSADQQHPSQQSTSVEAETNKWQGEEATPASVATDAENQPDAALSTSSTDVQPEVQPEAEAERAEAAEKGIGAPLEFKEDSIAISAAENGTEPPQEQVHDLEEIQSPEVFDTAHITQTDLAGEEQALGFLGQTVPPLTDKVTGQEEISAELRTQEVGDSGETVEIRADTGEGHLPTQVEFYTGAGVTVEVGSASPKSDPLQGLSPSQLSTPLPIQDPSDLKEGGPLQPDSAKTEVDSAGSVPGAITAAGPGGTQEELLPPGGVPTASDTGVSEQLPVSPLGVATEQASLYPQEFGVVSTQEVDERSRGVTGFIPPGGEVSSDLLRGQEEGVEVSALLPEGCFHVNTPDIIVLPSPLEDADIPSKTQEEVKGQGQQGQGQGLSPASVRSLSQSPEEQWFETETDLPPPPGFSDTNNASSRVGTQEESLPPAPLEGSTALTTPGSTGGAGAGGGGAKGGDIGSSLQGPSGASVNLLQGDTGGVEARTGEEVEAAGKTFSADIASVGTLPVPDYSTSSTTGEVLPSTGGEGVGLLAIAVQPPEYGDYTQPEPAGGLSRDLSPRAAFSPLLVRPSRAEQQPTTTTTTLLPPLRVEVTGQVVQAQEEEQAGAALPASSDVTAGVTPGGEAWRSSVVGEQQQLRQQQQPGGGGGGAGGGGVGGPSHPTTATGAGGGEGGAITTYPPPLDLGSAAPLTTQAHLPPPVLPPAYTGGDALLEGISTTPLPVPPPPPPSPPEVCDLLPPHLPPTQPPPTIPAEPEVIPPPEAEEEIIIECGPVRASTFSPRLSSPSSVNNNNRDVKVAAATISLRPSPSPTASPRLSPTASPRSPRSPRTPETASPVSSKPEAEPEASASEEEGQTTCVSKVTSFVLSSTDPEQPSPVAPEPKPSVDFNHYSIEPSNTLVYNNPKYQHDIDDGITGGYGGYPQDNISSNNFINNQKNNNNPLEEEDITTIATVNVKSKKKVRQRAPHQQLQFEHHQYSRSSSVPDNSIYIASHKPQEDSGAFFQGFDRTLQFGPSGRQRRRRMSDAFVREDAMMEGTRMLIENLREKQHLLEEKCARLEREKTAVGDLLTVKKTELLKTQERSRDHIGVLETTCSRLESENCRLLERLNLPEPERSSLRAQEVELEELRRKLGEAEELIGQQTEESVLLQNEIKDMHLEMEEMHDQFRDDEALEFRDMQKELEATAKNCRILQFKLRKAERRNDAMQSERLQFDEKIRILENRTANNNEQNQIRELEEELRMAKEVSVRLHDELESVEDRRAKFQDELERVHDLLLDSEKGRSVLQKEVLTLTEEVEQLRERDSENSTGDKLDVPKTEKPTLGKKGKEGSVEYDVEQLMRDLADSLEREHDLKGQLEHAEEETLNLRKKLSDLEDENEVIQIQLQKMSSAKSGKYFQSKSVEEDTSSDQEHELRLQLELAEEEIHVLRRKMDETDAENTSMKKEVRRLQLKLAGKDSKELEELEDTRSYDERITAMAQDIDDLKWRLIQKDQESASKDDVERDPKDEMERAMHGERRPVKLSKSVSLDSGDVGIDVRRQLDSVAEEAGNLKEMMHALEKENEELKARNQALEVSSRGVPAVTADDSALQNIELQDKIQTLEADNSGLRNTIKSLDERTTALSKEVNRVHGSTSDSAETKEQLRRLETDVAMFQKTINELQESNKKLAEDLRQYEQTDEGKESKAQRDDLNLETAGKPQLRERIKDMESDIKHLQTVVKNRESENEKLEREVTEYRDDMDKMLETFKDREAALQSELQSWEQKNSVLANLLDLVTERAESIKSSEKQSERSASVVSAISDVTMGSDDVFGEKADVDQDWDEKFLSRIRSLEDLLKEERQKVQAVEKRLLIKDGQQSALTDDMKLHEREKEILQQEQKQKQILEQERAVIQEELALCQRQLAETSDQSLALRDKLDKMHKVQSTLRQAFQRVSGELETEKKKTEEVRKKLEAKEAELKKTAAAKEEEKKGAGAGAKVGGGVRDKEPASWRWEKQELERSNKDLKKKVDDLHRQLSRQQVRVKMAGDDQRPRLGRQDSTEGDSGKTKELETEIKTLKEEADKRKADIANMDKDIQEVQKTLKSQEEQWNTEREVLESDRTSVIKELSQKDEVLKAKDEIIKQKDGLLQQRERALKERENSMLTHDLTLKEKDDAYAKIQEQLTEVTEQLTKLKEEVKQREESQREMELKIKELNAAVSARDGRIKEKDDILENLNRTLSEKESSIGDMDNTIRQAMKSVDEKESELKTLQSETEEQKVELVNLKNKSDDFERKLHATEKEHGKEIASLVILREKMEAHITQLNTEKNLADSEVQDLKRVMMEKEDFWRSCRNDLEGELRSAKETVHTLECSRTGSEGSAIRRLNQDKEDLTNEKNILVKEVKRLAREMENAESEWQKERREFRQRLNDQQMADSKTKLVRQSSLEAPPEAAAAAADVTLQAEDTERSAALRRAEIAGIEQLYENKLRIAREQLKQTQEEVEQLRRDTIQSRDLLMSSQKTLSELKHKYDVEVTTFHDEKVMLERRAVESDDRRRQADALQRVVEQLESQVRQAESERAELDGRYRKATADWDAERLRLQAQLNRLEEQSAQTSSGKFKWSEKTKRESAWDKERSDHQRTVTEYQNLVRDLEVRVRTAERSRDRDHKDLMGKLDSTRRNLERENNDLRKRNTQMEEKSKQVAGLQKTLIDLQYKLQSDREAWLRERGELQRQLTDAERTRLDEKRKFTELLAEVRKVKELTPLLAAKAEGVELEITRSKDAPLSPTTGGATPDRSSRVYSLPPSGTDQQQQHPGGDVVRTIPIRRLVDEPYDLPLLEDVPGQGREGRAVYRSTSLTRDGNTAVQESSSHTGQNRNRVLDGEALQHISQLAEELNKTDVKRSTRPSAPPAFRRSLSTSEVEDYREYVEYAEQQEQEALSRAADLHTTTTTTPYDQTHPLSTKPPAPPAADSTNTDATAQLRSRSHFRRALSAQVPDIQVTSSTGNGRSSRPGSARNSMYASGTQSAYSSRDASPERRYGVRKITPYPVAPPSFLITPSRTPRRITASVDREISMPEKHLQRLYDKLSAIEKEQTEEDDKQQQRLQREGSVDSQADVIDNRRRSGMRMLVKSMSVDSYREDPNWMPTEAERDPNAHFCPKQLDTVFDDAPKSQTLPASVRLGALSIVPGQDPLAGIYNAGGKVQALSNRRKSQDARKEFYDNYPLYSSGFFSWPRKSRRDKHQEEMEAALAATQEAQEAAQRQQLQEEEAYTTAEAAATATVQEPEPKKVIVPIGKHKKEKEKEKDKEEKKESKISFFFSSVKERRKMFMKKSKSVDESPIRKSVMQAGLQAGRAAAPSTFETPPQVKEQQTTPAQTATTTSRPSSLRKRFHKRAASLDVTSLFSVSSGASSSTSGATGSSEQQGQGTSTSNSGSGHNRHSSTGTSGVSTMTSSSSSASTSGSGSKDQSRDGTCRQVADFEVPPSSPSLTPNFRRVRAQPGRRPPSRWRTPSMEKASQRPLVFRDSDTNRFKIVVKRRSLSESNVVFLEHMQASKVWSFSETRV